MNSILKIFRILSMVFLSAMGSQVFAQAVSKDLSSKSSDTIYVSPPTGQKEIDRANIQEAFDAVQPGGTVQFKPGTYMLAGGARLTVPDVTVLGHPEGTILRGCDPDAFAVDESQMASVVFGCTGFYIQAQRQTIRGLTFEFLWHGIVAGPYPTSEEEASTFWSSEEVPVSDPVGGQVIEGNIFRSIPNGLRMLGTGEEISIIRDNDFIDVFHAIGIYGSPIHFLKNRIIVEDPTKVPFSLHPGSAIIVGPVDSDCSGHVVKGNLIDGYPDPIYINVDPGEECRGVELSDNIIHAQRVKIPRGWYTYIPTQEDSTMVGTPMTLMNRTKTGDGEDEPDIKGVLENILVKGNSIIGGDGLGILAQNVSNSRILNNNISGIKQRKPFPGITWDGYEQNWEDANGSSIWLSPGSDGNEITGNTFEDIASYAVLIEGDSNRVAMLDLDNEVRDLGIGNILKVPSVTDEFYASGDEDKIWSAEQLKPRAALIYIQHAAFSLIDARERGLTPTQHGRRIGEIIARNKRWLDWNTSSNALLANALAKLIEPEYELEFGEATFTLRSRYKRAGQELSRYGSSIEEYINWLNGMHSTIGPVQGYGMSARIEGDCLIETYRDLPNRKGLEPRADPPLYKPSPEELWRYEGAYTGSIIGDTTSVSFKMRVWQENGLLRITTWRLGEREPYGRHLIPVAENIFLPGWYSSEGPVEVQENAMVRFSATDSNSAMLVELEVEGENGADLIWRLRRD